MRVVATAILCFLPALFTSQSSFANQSGAQTPEPSVTQQGDTHPVTAKNAQQENRTGIRDYLRSLDETLDATLAATLAGLALAAAAFLLPLEQKRLGELADSYALPLAELRQLLSSPKRKERLDARKKLNHLREQASSAEDEGRLNEFEQIDKAIKSMIWAFFFFVLALVDSILIDGFSELKGELDAQTLADLTVSTGGTIAGIGWMVRSAYLIRKIVSPGRLIGENGADEQNKQ